MNDIKAIETIYKGYKFRSRLEARWAVFFDALGLKWEYEKEGYELPDGTRYLPDFWLPEKKYWIEIKGQDPTPEEEKKCYTFAQAMLEAEYREHRVGPCVFILVGPVPLPPQEQGKIKGYHIFGSTGRFVSRRAWSECPLCGDISIAQKGAFTRPARDACKCAKRLEEVFAKEFFKKVDGDHWWGQKVWQLPNTSDSPRLIAAYTAARQARFEHGQ